MPLNTPWNGIDWFNWWKCDTPFGLNGLYVYKASVRMPYTVLRTETSCFGQYPVACADPESFVRGCPDFFLVNEGIEDPNTTINGQSSARQRNAI